MEISFTDPGQKRKIFKQGLINFKFSTNSNSKKLLRKKIQFVNVD